MKLTKEAKERVAKVCAVSGGPKKALYALYSQLVAARDELQELRADNAQLTAALRDMLSTVRASTKAGVAAMQRAKQTLEQPEPGTPILTIDCPRCGAELEIEHGDEPGEIRCHRHAGGWW